MSDLLIQLNELPADSLAFFGIVVLAGLIMGVAPSSLPLVRSSSAQQPAAAGDSGRRQAPGASCDRCFELPAGSNRSCRSEDDRGTSLRSDVSCTKVNQQEETP